MKGNDAGGYTVDLGGKSYHYEELDIGSLLSNAKNLKEFNGKNSVLAWFKKALDAAEEAKKVKEKADAEKDKAKKALVPHSTAHVYVREDDYGTGPNREKTGSAQDHIYVGDSVIRKKEGTVKDVKKVDTTWVIRPKKKHSMKYIVVVITLYIAGCQAKNLVDNISIEKDGLILKGIAIDSVFTDTVFYFDKRNTLVRKDVFEDGVPNGQSVIYYNTGSPSAISTYTNGLKNGYNFFYDRSGKCYYQDFYYYDLPVGPVIHFDSASNPLRYFFVNIQNETLLDIDYRNWKGTKSIASRCIHFTSNVQRVDSGKKLFVLLYLPSPPKLKFDFSILTRKRSSANEFTTIAEVENGFPFRKFALDTLPDNSTYTVELNVYDSLLNKYDVIYMDID